MAVNTIDARKPTGHLYVAERQDGRVWYAKWRDAEGQHQKKLGPAWSWGSHGWQLAGGDGFNETRGTRSSAPSAVATRPLRCTARRSSAPRLSAIARRP